jgi:PKD repeat protein
MDIAVAKSGPLAVMIDGQSGNFIWSATLADQSWNIDRIEDINGDGINDVIIGTLFGSNYCYFLDGTTGETIHSFNFGEAVDGIGAIPDITGDGSMEMVAGGRDGKLYCYSGGLNSIQPLTADFMADTTFGYVPFDVSFTDLTTSNVTDWEWDFDNDGITDSYEQNPVYTYTEIGLFTVTLIVSNNVISDTAVKIDYITADSTVNIQNYVKETELMVSPNPFSELTTVSYYLNQNTDVFFDIYKMNGEKIKTIVASLHQKKGVHTTAWDGTNSDGQKVQKGIYVGKLCYGNKSLVTKLVVN